MSKTSSFGFTNSSISEVKSLAPSVLSLVDNYAIKDEPNQVTADNKTAPLDQPELITFRCRDIAAVNSGISNQYPAPVSTGVQYVIQVDELLSTRDDAIGYRVDDPIVAYLTIRHPKSGNVTVSHIEQVLQRLLGACYKNDGTSRFSDLMRSALEPNNN